MAACDACRRGRGLMPPSTILNNVKTPLATTSEAFEFSRGLAKGPSDNDYLHHLTV
jgi:hypothetical protein